MYIMSCTLLLWMLSSSSPHWIYFYITTTLSIVFDAYTKFLLRLCNKTCRHLILPQGQCKKQWPPAINSVFYCDPRAANKGNLWCKWEFKCHLLCQMTWEDQLVSVVYKIRFPLFSVKILFLLKNIWETRYIKINCTWKYREVPQNLVMQQIY